MADNKVGRGRLSSIHTLPEEVRVFVVDALRDNRLSQKQIMEQANELLEELEMEERISRSALNRFAMATERAAREVRVAREVAEQIVGDLGDVRHSDLGRATVEMVRTLTFKTANKMLAGEELDAESLKDLSLSVQRVQKAAMDCAKFELLARDAKKADEDNEPRDIVVTWADEDEDDE